MKVRELLKYLKDLTEEQKDLPVVITRDCWQWELKEDEAPKLAFWDGSRVGTPKTLKDIEDNAEYLGTKEERKLTKPCLAIGYID